MSQYTASEIKTFKGRAGEGFSATLKCAGKAVCEVLNEASGGQFRFKWLDALDAPHVTYQTRNCKGELVESRGSPDEAAYSAYVLERGSYEEHGQSYFHNTDTITEEIVYAVLDAHRQKASIKRLLKDRVLFVVNGEAFETKKCSKGTDPLTLVDAVKEKHPTAQIMNLLPLDEAVSILTTLCGPVGALNA